MNLYVFIEICLIFLQISNLYCQNPIMPDISTADPAAMVYGDSMYIYAGNDEDNMESYHVLSSADMVHWKDHGRLLKISDFAWAQNMAWAGQCIERDGKFYWYVPLNTKSGEGMKIGVAVGNSLTGPFTDAIGIPLVEGFDPAVFIDKDGQAYLYSGSGTCEVMLLEDNMVEPEGTKITIPLPDYFEAPYMHERDGTYYLSYCSSISAGQEILYATATSPFGPFTFQSRLCGPVDTWSNHQSIAKFKGQWYFIYHINGKNRWRSTAIDYLYYNSNGTMKEIVQTSEGVDPVGTSPVNIKHVMQDNEKNLFTIYPNPSSNHEITIDLSVLVNPRVIMIFDINGNIIYSYSTINSTLIKPGIDLSPSVYFVKVLTANKVYIRKLVIY